MPYTLRLRSFVQLSSRPLAFLFHETLDEFDSDIKMMLFNVINNVAISNEGVPPSTSLVQADDNDDTTHNHLTTAIRTVGP